MKMEIECQSALRFLHECMQLALFFLTSRTIHIIINQEGLAICCRTDRKEGLPVKNKGLLLILAGVVVILAGIAIYGYVSVNSASTMPAAVAAQAGGASAPVGFDAMYDMLAATGQTDVLAANNTLLNFLIRYRLVFFIAAIVAALGSAAVCILPRRKAKDA